MTLNINFYFIQQPKLQLQLHNSPFSTAISILQLQKVDITARYNMPWLKLFN